MEILNDSNPFNKKAKAEELEALLDKKLRGDVSDRREREKAMAALQRRGFTFSQIREAMADYCAAIAEEETR